MGRHVDAEDWMASPTGYGRRKYITYVPHPLTEWSPVLNVEMMQTVAAATGALAATETVPSAAVANWMIARDESIRSSIMEDVDSTGNGLAWAQYMDQAGKPVSDENDALTLGALKQVHAAVALGQRVRSGAGYTVGDICSLHRVLFEGTRDRSIAGELRDGPIWIGPSGCLIDAATFVPPTQDRVPELLTDLVGYLNSDQHPGVIQAAIAHAQFETIHPFEDGNGRTGRALIHAVFNARGLTNGAVPISTVLGKRRDSYHAALNAMRVVCAPDDTASRSAGMTPWVELLCVACHQAEKEATAVAQVVHQITEDWQASTSFRSDGAASALLQVLPSMPVTDAKVVADRLEVTPQVARSALRSLERAGIVTPIGERRNKRYTVPTLIDLMPGVGTDGGWVKQPVRYPNFKPSVSARSDDLCGHRGVRSKKLCVLGKGHREQHRYGR